MMRKRGIALAIVFLLLLNIAGCKGDQPESGAVDDAARFMPPEYAGFWFLSDDNPIDRAFARMIDERWDELADNTILTYQYALEWYNQYIALAAVLDGDTPEVPWESRAYDDRLSEWGLGYAKRWRNPDEATAQFAEIARFCKLMAYDCLDRLEKQGAATEIQADEEQIYRHLNDANYAEYIPEEFDNPYIYEADDYPNKNPMPVYAKLESEDIHLAFAPPFGVVLSVKDKKYLYDWPCWLTPRLVLPRLAVSDYDGDGEDELAVILYVGSGTGLSVEELYIVELHENMRDMVVTGERIESSLNNRLSAAYDAASQIVTVRLDNQTIRVDTSMVEKEKEQELRGLDMQSIIHFSENNGALSVESSVGVSGFDAVIPFGYFQLYADVILDQHGNIRLVHCRIEKTPDIS